MAEAETPRRRRRYGSLAVASALTALWLSRWTRVEVLGASMTPALWPGDRLLVRRGRRARRGDIVVVRAPSGRVVVKRLAGRAGDATPEALPGGVHGGEIFVLGDHPAASTDSRHWGALPAGAVWGRAVAVYHPPDRARMLPRPVPQTSLR